MPEYIEREALNAAIHESWQSNPHNNPIARQTHNHEHRHFLSLLHKQPAADVAEVRHGYWKQADNTRRGHKFVCSVCNRVSYYPQPTRDRNWVKHCGYAHCPYCLAKMDGKGEGE